MVEKNIKIQKKTAVHFSCVLVFFAANLVCQAVAKPFVPFTDPSNEGGWILNKELSDEFDSRTLDEDKWQVQGRDGKYQSHFKGRADPRAGWQFSPDNVRVEDGLLKIQTRYEPDYAWVNPGTNTYEFTTGGVSTKKTFLLGYMEIKCKAANAKTTSAFWTTGHRSELDVFEAIGKHATRKNLMWSSIHDWLKPIPNHPWTETHPLPFNFADDFHVYGAEWDNHSVKIYADGQLISTATREWVAANGIHSTRWPLEAGQHVWADSEIFPWWGVPAPDSLPADYEVEYIRVWQNPDMEAAPEKIIPKTATIARPLQAGDSTLEHFIGLEKEKWEKNGWRWNQSKVEQLFILIDTDHDGIASGLEKKTYWDEKMKK